MTNACEWKYCSTTVNPADLLTRGITNYQLKSNSGLWMTGTKFLVTDEFAKQITNPSLSLLIEEAESQEPAAFVADDSCDTQTGIQCVMDIERYGSYRKLIDVTS